MFLVDANVLSEPTRATPDLRVVQWLRDHETELAIDPFILGEVRFGIHLLPAGRKRRRLEQWFDGGIARVHCLTWDAETGLTWASLLGELRRSGKAMPVKDSLIAATARHHDLPLVTRNERDFAASRVRILNPFSR